MADEEYPILEPAFDVKQAQLRAFSMCIPIFGEVPTVSVDTIYEEVETGTYKIPQWTFSCKVPTKIGDGTVFQHVNVGPYNSLLECIRLWNITAAEAKKALFTEDLIGERRGTR